MPKTMMFRKTWYCNVCRVGKNPGETDNQGGWDTGVPGPVPCPRPGCPGTVTMETDTARMGRMIVMALEDIDAEVEERTETTFRARERASVAADIAARDADGDFATATQRDRILAARRAQVEKNIERMKLEAQSPRDAPAFTPSGHFLDGPGQMTSTQYRARRLDDITRAIAAARLLEYKV